MAMSKKDSTHNLLTVFLDKIEVTFKKTQTGKAEILEG
jgi:hypothetical protein